MKLSLSNAVAAKVVPLSEPRLVPLKAAPTVDPTNLIGYQVPSVVTMVNAVRDFHAVLDASDAGTGKTYVACAVARHFGLRLLVVCPKVVVPAWIEVATYMGAKIADVLTYEKVRNGNTRWMKHRVGPTGSRAKADREFYWCLDQNYLLIFDEGHSCKGQDSQNSKLLIAAAKQQLNVILCSATAATSPLEMKALGYALGLHRLSNFWSWCRDHGSIAGDYGGLVFDKNSDRSKRVLINLHTQIFPRRGMRLRISELGDAFPESQISAQAYDMGTNRDKIQSVYDEMQQEIAKLDQHTGNFQANVLAVMLAARMNAELLKVPALVELASDALEEGQSVALFLNFRDSIAAVAKRLKTDCFIVGGQTTAERSECIRRFQADESRVVVCNIASGGVGVSLHDLRGEYPRLSLISPNYSAIQLRQTLGRVWRQGGKTKSVQKIVFASGTIEEAACRAVRAKLQNLALLNDGDLKAGIQF